MSVQGQPPSDMPDSVRADVLGTGEPVVATVLETDLEATARSVGDVLLVEHDGSRYRVDAADATAI